MSSGLKALSPNLSEKVGPLPNLTTRRLGIASRDYNRTFPNGYRDFSFVLAPVARFFDERKADTILFSLYAIVPRRSLDVIDVLRDAQLSFH